MSAPDALPQAASRAAEPEAETGADPTAAMREASASMVEALLGAAPSPEGEVEGLATSESPGASVQPEGSAERGVEGPASPSDPSTPALRAYAQGDRDSEETSDAAADTDPAAWIERRARRMGFFPLLSLLERLTDSEAPIGGEGPFAQEPVRLRHDSSMGFSNGDVAWLKRVKGPGRPPFELAATFLGLTGAVGPLPSFYAEEIAQEDGSSARRDFLDIFHHRLLSLLFRGVTKYDLAEGATVEADDAWARRVLALAGVDAAAAPPGVPAPVLLRLAPLFATCRRPPEALELVISEAFGAELEGARVEVIPFTGEWTEIEPDQRMRLGRANRTLGETTVLGQRVFDCGSRFTLRIAPLSQRVYPRLLPDGDLHARVGATVSFFAGGALEFDLELGLAAPPALRLSRDSSTRLGRDTWLRSRLGESGKTLRIRGSANLSPGEVAQRSAQSVPPSSSV